MYKCNKTLNVEIESFLSLSQDWDELLESSRHKSLFLTWTWIKSWLYNFQNGGIEHIAVVRNEGRIVGIAPFELFRRKFFRSELRFIGQTYSYSLGFIAKIGMEATIYDAIWDFVFKEALRKKYFISLRHLREDSVFEESLKKKVEYYNFAMESDNFDPSKILTLPSDFEKYLTFQITSKKFRKSLRNDLNKIDNGHWDFFFAPNSMIDVYLAILFKFHIEDMSARGVHSFLFQKEIREHFFQIVKEFAKRSQLRLAVLNLDGSTVAVLLGIALQKRFYSLIMGIDHRVRKKNHMFNFCFLIHSLCIKHSIFEGFEAYDFLGGGSKYKMKMGAQEADGRRVIVYRSNWNKIWIGIAEKLLDLRENFFSIR
ncbi:MAG: GNAT family N-acetyltransferase [Candidatus Riflebacteria bacterium]|nr:GNAT family N-acetyltransferase [Candidatus Riflebacteria bacterium]